MKAKETVDYQIKTCWSAIAKMYNYEASKSDMTMSIGYVLLNIDIETGTPATKIAPEIGLEVRSLTRTLKNMEEDGLIYRKSDSKDKRMVKIYLTLEGLRKREISRQTVLAFNKAVQEKIGQEKLKEFFNTIEEINRIVENNEFNIKAESAKNKELTTK